MNQSKELEQQIVALLNKANLSPNIHAIHHCANGGNNRTYKIETTDGIFAVKKYFRQSADTRDRLTAEFSFLSYAKKIAPDMVPTPYSQDQETAMALYEFIDGVSLKASDITAAEIAQACQFFCILNQPQTKAEAVDLPLAAEACFRIDDHLHLVGTRIQSLQQIVAETAEDKAAQHLIYHLSAYWQLLLHEIKQIATVDNINLTLMLDNSQRAISPSDFGFHNALKTADGRIRFLDFEYAGWDDPAKMVGDFFSQLAVPVSADYFDSFVQEVMTPFSQPHHLVRRAQLLRSVYQVKWCCIALNVFIPVNLARRRFAHPELDIVDLKKMQLAKAKSLLQKMYGKDKVRN